MYLYQLHIYIKIILLFYKFSFFIITEMEYQYKKTDEKIIMTKLRETILTMTNHNLKKSK